MLLAPLASADDNLTLMGPDGRDVELKPAEGQVLLLHFWATWCPTCIEDIRHLQSAATACSDERVRVVLVNVGEGDDIIRDFVKEHEVRLPVLRDPKGRLWRRTDGRGLPANLFWSNEGKRTDVGSKTETEWRNILASQGCPNAHIFGDVDRTMSHLATIHPITRTATKPSTPGPVQVRVSDCRSDLEKAEQEIIQ